MAIDPGITERYRAVTTASVSDALSLLGVGGTMSAAIKPAFPARLVGPAVTVLEEPQEGAGAPEHALEAIDTSAAGSVVVIGIGGETEVAVWGGLMTAGATARGLAGAVLDGPVRDVEEIERDFGFPVFSRGVSPRTTVGRYRTVAAGVEVVCGGVAVSPGDLVVGDRDGVCVVPESAVDEVLRRAEEIEETERRTTARIAELGSIRQAVAELRRI